MANIAKVPTICIEIACMHAQAKIALLKQLEQYLNDLLPSCFGVQIEGSFAVPFQHGHFSLHCTHLVQTGAQWDDLHVGVGGAVRSDVKHHTMQAGTPLTLSEAQLQSTLTAYPGGPVSPAMPLAL